MKWEKMSQEAARRLEALVQPFACEKKPMFGHEVYFVNGNMFAGIFEKSTWLRLSAKDQAEIMKQHKDAKLFEPMKGRPMKDYVVVPEPLLEDRQAIGMWLARSYEYTASLPEKKAKPKKK